VRPEVDPELRPVVHCLQPRIRAPLLCWLALLLIRVTQRRTAMTWQPIAIELARLHPVNITGTIGRSSASPRSTPSKPVVFGPVTPSSSLDA
jgi:hypothetical protein